MPRAEDVISGLVDRFGEDKLALAASWQKETAVLVDMVTKIAPKARIFTLDTGALFEETYATWRLVEERYGIKVEAYRGEWVPGMWATDPDRCCFLRKVEPLERALAGAECWISGVRRDQSPDRAATEEVDWDAPPRAVEGEPARRLERARRLGVHQRERPPVQPACTTRATTRSAARTARCPARGRAGRWAGRDKDECGIHVPASR